MRSDRGVSKIEDRANSLGRPPHALPPEISDWFEVNQNEFGGREDVGREPNTRGDHALGWNGDLLDHIQAHVRDARLGVERGPSGRARNVVG